MISSHSIVVTVKLKDNSKVTVQADKLYRICDVIYPFNLVKPFRPAVKNTASMKEYQEQKKDYDMALMAIKNKRQLILNYFRGRQLNSETVLESLISFIKRLG